MSKEKEKMLVPKLRFPEFQNAGEWTSTTFGGAATFINGRAYKQEELLDKGKYRVLRVGNFFSNKEWYYSDLDLEENKYCDDGDLLYAWSASFGPRIWRGEKVIYHYHIWKVIEKKGIDKDFLFILLGYETERMKAQSANGLGLLHITKSAIEGWDCQIPKIKEQQKIADCLSSVDDLITAQAQKVDALKAHKKGLMQQLFPAEGETVPKLRFPEFQDAGEWEEASLVDISSIRSGATPLRSNSEFYEGGTIPWVKTLDLNNSFINQTDECITSKAKAKINPEGSVLVAMYGGFNQIGRTGLLKVPAATNQAMSVLNTDRKKIIPVYLLAWLNAKVEFWKSIASSSRKDPNITGSDVAGFPIIYPKIEEQKKIADCLSSVDDLITAQTQKVDALKAHKKGLMQRLFPGMDGESA